MQCERIDRDTYGGVDRDMYPGKKKTYKNFTGHTYTKWEHFQPLGISIIPGHNNIGLINIQAALDSLEEIRNDSC